jgi:predicted flap endonuclease-1-like 5' DNA nuclease
MSWLNTVGRSVANGVQGLASGVWAAVATPFVHTPLRPVTKQAIKGGLWMAHGARSLVEGTQQEWHTLVAEAEAEAHPDAASSARRAVVGDDGQAEKQADATAETPSLTAVKGIGDDYARLLEAAGIPTIEELAARPPESLRARLLDVNETHEIVGRVPSTDRIRDWIERAGEHVE